VECIHCKGEMKRAKAPLAIHRKGYHVLWDALPAWVCTQCGEPYFEAKEVDSVQRALSALERECPPEQKAS